MGQYTARVAAQALTAATVETLLQVIPGTKPVYVIELGIGFISTTSTDAPVAVDLMRQTTAGTSSALTLVKDDERDENPIATALQAFTAEPTSGDILRTWPVTPVGGLFVVQFPLGREPVALTSRIALRCNAPQAQTATGYLTLVE